jgi:hypothetical protein
MPSNENKAFLSNVLLGAGLYILDSLRERLAENVRDLGEKTRNSHVDLPTRGTDVHSEGLELHEHANKMIIGNNNRYFLDTANAAIIGVGVGFGIGMIFAPASGEETRRNIGELVRDLFV